MSDPSICPVCHNPKKSKSAGSLTQWIVACNCEALDTQEAQELSVKICKDCGKRIGEGRSGSFTQFIFRSDVCQCKNPNPQIATEAPAESPPAQDDTIQYEEEMENELDLDPDEEFPEERYKPLARLGSGASGAVYLARDRLLNKRVAVKTLHALDPKQMVAFQEEARATSLLKHKSIVAVLDFGVMDSGVPYMVLEFVPGQSLEQQLEQSGPMHWTRSREILSQVADALSYAHENGVFHRDIKPNNILISHSKGGEHEVRLIDFGIAKVQGERHEDTGKTVVGAPLYMSPDQGMGRPYSERSEIYSVGCVLFETLTGRTPFEGENALATLRMHANEEPPHLVDFLEEDDVPEELETLVSRCLEKDPDNRFQSLAEFKSAFSEVPLPAKELPPPEPLLAQPEKPNDLKYAAAGLLLMLLGFGMGVAVMHIRDGIRQQAEKKTNVELQNSIIEDVNADEALTTKAVWEINPPEAYAEYISDKNLEEMIKDKPVRPIKKLIIKQSSVHGWGLKYWLDQPLTFISIHSPDFDDSGAEQIARFKKLRSVRLEHPNKLTVKGLRDICSLPELKFLQYRYINNMPADAIKIIASSRTLRGLDMGHNRPFTKEQLATLASAPSLKSLAVAQTTVDDSYLEGLENSKFTHLDLNHTRVTDEGLAKIEKFDRLRRICLTPSQYISEDAIEKLKSARPDIKVVIKDDFSAVLGVLRSGKKKKKNRGLIRKLKTLKFIDSSEKRNKSATSDTK